MLKIPELAMNKKKSVKTKCHGEVIKWKSREEAKEFFLEATSAYTRTFILHRLRGLI